MAQIKTGSQGRRTKLGGEISQVGGRGLNVPAATGRLAKALGDIGEDIQRRHERIRGEQDITHKNEVFNEYNKEARKFETEQTAKVGLDTGKWNEDTDKWDEDIRSKLLKNTPEHLVESINQKFEVGKEQIKRKLSVHHVKESNKAKETQRSLSLDNNIFNVGEAPALLENEIADYVNTIEEYEANGSYDTVTADALIIEGTNKIAQASADSTLNSNPEKLIVDINEGIYDGKLTQKQKDDFISSANTQIKAIETEQRRQVAQSQKDAKDAKKTAQAVTENDYISRLDNKDNPVTWTEVTKSDLEPSQKLKWRKILEDMTEDGEKITDQLSIDTYDELTTLFDSFDENTSEDIINKGWSDVQSAFGKGKDGGISKTDYNQFQERRDKALEKADPINTADFKSAEASIKQFETDGGFLPPDEDGNIPLKKDATPDQKLQGRERHKVFVDKMKKWRQDNPDGNVQKWINEQFEPVEKEVTQGWIGNALDFMFQTNLPEEFK